MNKYLGFKVRDTITGFEGVVVAYTVYLFDEAEVVVQPEHLNPEDGSVPATRSFPVKRVKIVK